MAFIGKVNTGQTDLSSVDRFVYEGQFEVSPKIEGKKQPFHKPYRKVMKSGEVRWLYVKWCEANEIKPIKRLEFMIQFGDYFRHVRVKTKRGWCYYLMSPWYEEMTKEDKQEAVWLHFRELELERQQNNRTKGIRASVQKKRKNKK